MQSLEQQIWELISAGVEDLNLRLVQVRIMGSEASRVLRIMIEPMECSKENPLSVNVDDCANVSRMVSALMDVEDPITEHYTLEVSSTGIERPLVSKQDFINYSGCRAKIKLNQHIEGCSRFTGIINGVEGEEILFTTDENTGVENKATKLPYNDIKTAWLKPTDEEIAEYMKSAKVKV